MPNVGKLIVDLEANTATFTGPLGNAERLARGNAKGIQEAFNGMELGSARGGIMVIDELIGIHIPRHVTALIAQMPFLGAAMEMAFPLLAVAAVGKALFELFEKMHAETDKLAESQGRFQTATFNAFSSLEQKILEAGIHTDELNKNHLAALKKQLELINTQSMEELVHSLGLIATAADAVFKDLESHWYTAGIGSEGAKHALTQFKTQYDTLLAQGKDKEASDLLKGTRESAEHILQMQEQYKANQLNASTGKGPGGQDADYNKFEAASLELKKAGVGVTEREVQSQQSLVNALQAQAKVEAEVATLKNIKTGNAGADTSQKVIEDLNKEWAETKKVKDAETKEVIAAYELQFQQGKITAGQLGVLKQAALDKQYQAEMDHFEKLEKLEARHPARLAIVQNEEKALTAAHNAQILDDYAKTLEAQKKLLEGLDRFEGEQRQKQAAEAKKAADQAIETAAKKNKAWLADMALIQGEGNKHIAQLDKEIADLQRLITQYHLTGTAAANVYAAIHQLSLRRQHDVDEEMRHSDKLGQVMRGTMREMILDGQQWKIKVADQFRNSVGDMNNALASFATTGKLDLQSFVQNAVQGFIMMALQYEESQIMMMVMSRLKHTEEETLDKQDKLKDANKAARKVFTAVMSALPFPADVIVAPISAAAAWTAVMAFEQGGLVPGTGNGDIVPAMLTPGERVLTRDENRALTSGKGSSFSSKPNININVAPGADVKSIAKATEKAVKRATREQMKRMRFVN